MPPKNKFERAVNPLKGVDIDAVSVAEVVSGDENAVDSNLETSKKSIIEEQFPADSKIALFNERLFTEGVDPSSKENGVLRGADGAYLSFSEFSQCCVGALKLSGYKNHIANHLFNAYVKEDADLSVFRQRRLIADFKGDKNDASSLKAKMEEDTLHLIEKMRDIIEQPAYYGIDLESQDTPRHLLQIDPEKLLGLLSDVQVEDPLYVNGQLPMPKPLGDSLKRAFEILYPDTDETTRRTRMLLKEKCVDQLVRELEQAERLQPKTEEGRIEKRKLVDTTVARITQFMREILTPEGVMEYVDAIATGVMSDDLVQFPTITKRPSYNETSVADKMQQGINNYNFYKKLTESYSKSEQEQLLTAFEDGDNSFFRDEAGTKSVTHVYFDVRLVLKQSGYDDVTIDTTFLPFIKGLIERMISLKQTVEGEYKKGFGRDQKKIEQCKQDLGTLRSTFIKEGKKQIQYAAFLSQIGTQAPADISSILGVEISDIRIEEIQAIEFTCSNFDDNETLRESFDVFASELEATLKPLRDGANANELGKNDEFIKTRDTYTVVLQDLEKLVTTKDSPNKDAIIKKSQGVIELHTSLVAFYESQVDTSDRE